MHTMIRVVSDRELLKNCNKQLKLLTSLFMSLLTNFIIFKNCNKQLKLFIYLFYNKLL